MIDRFENIPGGTGGLESYIYDLIIKYRPYDCLEIGTQYGKTASYITLALNTVHPNGFNFVCVDPFINEGKNADENWKENLINNDSFPIKPLLIKKQIENTNLAQYFKKIDFVLIDGNHEKYDVINNFEQVYKLLSVNCVVILDDIKDHRVLDGLMEIIKQHHEFSYHIEMKYHGFCEVKRIVNG